MRVEIPSSSPCCLSVRERWATPTSLVAMSSAIDASCATISDSIDASG